MSTNAEFVNAYVNNLKKKIDELMGSLVILETKIEFLEADNERLHKVEEDAEAHRVENEKFRVDLESANGEVERLRGNANGLGETLHRERTEAEENKLQMQRDYDELVAYMRQLEAMVTDRDNLIGAQNENINALTARIAELEAPVPKGKKRG
jgi:chromosome segregation ATPase